MCEWFTFANIQYIWIEIHQSILLWSLSLMLPSPFNLECSSSHVCTVKICNVVRISWWGLLSSHCGDWLYLKAMLSPLLQHLPSVVAAEPMIMQPTMRVKDSFVLRLHQTRALSAQLDCQRQLRAAVMSVLWRQRQWRHGLLMMTYVCLCQESKRKEYKHL